MSSIGEEEVVGHNRSHPSKDSQGRHVGRPLDRRRVLIYTFQTAVAGYACTALTESKAMESELSEYMSPEATFALQYPSSFKEYGKPLKTHKVEVNFKSEAIRGYEIGVAVDPVKIESLEKFGSPQEVGERVVKVEEAKDGTLDTRLLDASAERQDGLSLYTLDYFVESTRGFKHFVAKVTIKDGLLYVCTGQVKEKDYLAVKDELHTIVRSFRVPA